MGEACADALKCPRLRECREAADRARWGAGYDAMRARVREIVDSAPPLSAEQRNRLAVLLTAPDGPRPPIPCPLVGGAV